MVGLGIYERGWTSVTLDIPWCDLQWIDVMPEKRFAELMCESNTTECNYMKMTLSDLWKNNFKGKLYHIRDILYPSAVMKGSLHSWFVSASHGVPLISGRHKKLHKTETFWMSALTLLYLWGYLLLNRDKKINWSFTMWAKGHILEVLLDWNKCNKSIL